MPLPCSAWNESSPAVARPAREGRNAPPANQGVRDLRSGDACGMVPASGRLGPRRKRTPTALQGCRRLTRLFVRAAREFAHATGRTTAAVRSNLWLVPKWRYGPGSVVTWICSSTLFLRCTGTTEVSMDNARKDTKAAAAYIEAALLRSRPAASMAAAIAAQDRLDQRSLALHALAAKKLEIDPSLLTSRVGPTLERFLTVHSGTGTARLLDVWKGALTDGLSQVLMICRDDSDRAKQLRQTSPVVTLLTPQERRSIYDAYATRTPH